MNALATRRRTVRRSVRRSDRPLKIAVTLEGRATAAHVQRFTVTDDGRLIPAASTAYALTEKGRAAGSFLAARTAHYEAINDSRFDDGVPDYDPPEVTASGIVMTVAADWYRAEGGFICEDCEQLEGCVCPDV